MKTPRLGSEHLRPFPVFFLIIRCAGSTTRKSPRLFLRRWKKLVISRRAKAFRYQHVQAIIVAIDQYAEAATGDREFFLNKPPNTGKALQGDTP